MKLIPVMTEKSMKLSKESGFTFYVPFELNKIQIKKIIENVYGVTVVDVKTINSSIRSKKNARGVIQKIKASKKAVVFLKSGDKIDLFEEEKKKTKKTKKETTK